MTVETTILEAIANFFKENNWTFSQPETEPILRMGFEGENGQWACFVKVREEQRQFLFYSVLPINVPEKKRLAVAEFLTRANYGLTVGNFEIDLTDGEVRYKTSMIFQGCALNSAVIEQLVYGNLLTMDQYIPGMMTVIYTNVSPLEAIAQIESQSE
ncbi:MAG: YbjN domain-containing protein [Potamolinea sp.]